MLFHDDTALVADSEGKLEILVEEFVCYHYTDLPSTAGHSLFTVGEIVAGETAPLFLLQGVVECIEALTFVATLPRVLLKVIIFSVLLNKHMLVLS